jgi:hypothetical protein
LANHQRSGQHFLFSSTVGLVRARDGHAAARIRASRQVVPSLGAPHEEGARVGSGREINAVLAKMVFHVLEHELSTPASLLDHLRRAARYVSVFRSNWPGKTLNPRLAPRPSGAIR